VGGFFGGLVGTLLAIPVAGAVHVIIREVWQATALEEEITGPSGERPAPRAPAETKTPVI
jgi:predicted PurR-regulated permease PerM